MNRAMLAILLLTFGSLTSGCVAPLLAGGTAVVVADQISEEESGGDGLF